VRIEAQVHAHSGGGWRSLTCRTALRSDSSGRPRCRGNGRHNGRRARCRCASECLDAHCECFGSLETLTSAVLVTSTRQQFRASLLGVELALEDGAGAARCSTERERACTGKSEIRHAQGCRRDHCDG
jgi:hypothetical protein